MAEAVDIAGAVLRLIRDPAHLSTTDLGLVHQVLAAMRPIIPPAPGAMDLCYGALSPLKSQNLAPTHHSPLVPSLGDF
jgi:hypothetical protein